jgi:hypothetical protein
VLVLPVSINKIFKIARFISNISNPKTYVSCLGKPGDSTGLLKEPVSTVKAGKNLVFIPA